MSINVAVKNFEPTEGAQWVSVRSPKMGEALLGRSKIVLMSETGSAVGLSSICNSFVPSSTVIDGSKKNGAKSLVNGVLTGAVVETVVESPRFNCWLLSSCSSASFDPPNPVKPVSETLVNL